MPITVNSTVNTSPFFPDGKFSRCAVHRADGRIGKSLGVKPRRVLGVAIVQRQIVFFLASPCRTPPIFFREIRRLENLTDFDRVTGFGRATLRPFHDFFF